MKIVADENIVALEQHYQRHGELLLLPGRRINRDDLRDADVLLVRSITRVDRALLEGSCVRFVATATSGTDHLDLDYLAAAGIEVAEAAGSNANAVVEYCLAGIAELIWSKGFSLRGKTAAIIGFGHVGRRLYQRLCELEVNCLVCDPFVEAQSRADGWQRSIPFGDLETALSADIITLHVPLTRTGNHSTHHMLDERRLAALRPGTLLINASRGEVVDNAALRQRLLRANDILTLLDVWENEPSISRDLLSLVSLGTPHIAGYSVEAKRSASDRNYAAFLRYFELSADSPRVEIPEVRPRIVVEADWHAIASAPNRDELALAACLRAVFPVIDLDRQLRGSGGEEGAAVFDAIRRDLAARREFAHYSFDRELIARVYVSESVANQLTSLGFAWH